MSCNVYSVDTQRNFFLVRSCSSTHWLSVWSNWSYVELNLSNKIKKFCFLSYFVLFFDWSNILSIAGAFVVCWTPWWVSFVETSIVILFSIFSFFFRHTYSAIQSLCESCKKNWIFANPMFHCVYFLCYLNSPINPFCYALANQQFKKTFTRILKLDLRRL